MPTPLTIDGALNLPGAPGLPVDALPFGLSASYNSKAEYEFNLVGAGSQTVNFGTIPVVGAKALLVVYEVKASAPPVLVTLNGGVTPIEIAQGGFFVLGSPVPVAGLTSMTIAYTGAGRIRVWLLG